MNFEETEEHGLIRESVRQIMKDFDLDYNMPLKAGKLLIGEKVSITIEIEGVAQAPKKSKPSKKK